MTKFEQPKFNSSANSKEYVNNFDNIFKKELECTKCGKIFPIDEFSNDIRKTDGKLKWCYECRVAEYKKRAGNKKYQEYARAGARKRKYKKYNFTEKEFEALLEKQGGHCFFCNETDEEKRLFLDYDFEADRARGIVCKKHMNILKNITDYKDIIKMAVLIEMYLKGE